MRGLQWHGNRMYGVGAPVGVADGDGVGAVGDGVGRRDGALVGEKVRGTVGAAVGATVGDGVGWSVGAAVGAKDANPLCLDANP